MFVPYGMAPMPELFSYLLYRINFAADLADVHARSGNADDDREYRC